MMTENERWILSYYRASEISGSMFFARLAKSIRNPDIQRDLTSHFADEAQHARYWSDCMQQMGLKPIRMNEAYQDQYFEAVGVPVNLMEVLAITKIFEARTINHYAAHRRREDVHPLVRATIEKIMDDEGWHLKWVTAAIKDMESEYGIEHVRQTLERYRVADEEIYGRTVREHDERFSDLLIAN